MYFINMSSTGIKTDNYDNLEADIIDVNDSLFIKKKMY